MGRSSKVLKIIIIKSLIHHQRSGRWKKPLAHALGKDRRLSEEAPTVQQTPPRKVTQQFENLDPNPLIQQSKPGLIALAP